MTKAGLLLNLPPIKNKAYSSKRSDNARTHALGKALESVATGWPVYSIRDAFQPLVKPDALDTAAFGQNRHYAPDRLLGGIFPHRTRYLFHPASDSTPGRYNLVPAGVPDQPVCIFQY